MMRTPAIGQFERLLTSIPPNTVHLILTTPLGTAILDPFAPESSGVREALERIGVSMTVRMGPPTAEELAQPSLMQNLSTLGLVAGGLLLWLVLSRRR